ncbi:MAG TPA: ABC transporter permease, partial [Acetobacteraceae bacterium]
GAPDVAILSYTLWQTSFAADPHILGRPILMNGAAYSVIGVMRPEFQYPHPVFRVWAPWRMTPDTLANRAARAYTLLARLRPGVSRIAAQAELSALAQALAREFPATNAGWHPVATPVTEQLLGDLRPILLALLGAVGFTLLIACMNVGNLAMARGVERLRELAVRAALGASRARIARQLLVENLLVAAAGGALGILFAKWWLRGLLLLLPNRSIPIIPGADQAVIDGRVFGLAALVSLVCGILFGLAPAWRLSAAHPGHALQETGRAGSGSVRQRRALSGLIALETALTVILLTGAGLLLRSFSHLTSVPLGFHPEQVLTVQIPSPWTDPSQRPNPADLERRMNYLHEIVGRVQALPGVTAAGIVTTLPFGPVVVQTRIFIEGRPAPAPGEDIRLQYRAASPDYFRAMGITLLRGRGFTESDRAGQPAVAIVNDAMARKHWPNENAVGKRFSFAGAGGPWVTVVGVIAGARQGLRDEPAPELYTSYTQTILGPQVSTIVLRTPNDPGRLAAAARAAIHQLDASQPVTEVKAMTRIVSESAARPRLYAVLLAVFAGLAMLLAGAGIFSVILWTVNQSTREIGIRMALGATPGQVLRAAMHWALVGAGAGVILGIAGAMALTRLLAAQLYGVTTTDPWTFGSVAVLLLAMAALAAYLPARRATRVDPMAALC